MTGSALVSPAISRNSPANTLVLATVRFIGYLARPQGAGPFSAVVLPPDVVVFSVR
jgi:hypothetical protein